MYCFLDIVTTVMPSIVPNSPLPISKYMCMIYCKEFMPLCQIEFHSVISVLCHTLYSCFVGTLIAIIAAGVIIILVITAVVLIIACAYSKYIFINTSANLICLILF